MKGKERKGGRKELQLIKDDKNAHLTDATLRLLLLIARFAGCDCGSPEQEGSPV